MSNEYPFAVVIRDGKAFGRRQHIACYSGYNLSAVNQVAKTENIESIYVNFQFHIDVEATIVALSKRRYQPIKSIKEIDEGQPRPTVDLFGQKVA